MSASELMSVGTRAVFAAYRQVQTTANNIANANTPGYSRQDVRLATAGSQDTGDGYIGRGVTVETVKRASDNFLAQKTNALTAAAGTDAARSTLLGQLEQVFGKTDTGVGAAVGAIFSAYADVSAAPADLSARQTLLGKMEDFASQVRAVADSVDSLQGQVQDDIRNSVSELNGRAQNIARLNVEVANAMISGHDPNELLDQRDQLVKELSQQMEVHTYTGSDGQMSVFLSNGESLVLGNHANRLSTQPDPADAGHLQLGLQLAEGLSSLPSQVVGEGRLAGLMAFQNDDLVSARSHLGQLVASVTLGLNAQQARGLDLSGAAGSTLFSVNGPQVLPNDHNAKDASGAYVSGVTATITDPAALQASEYTVQADAAGGSYTVTRLSDGKVTSGVASGTVIDGWKLETGANAPAAGESFRVKPVALAAKDLQVVLRNPSGLAAANPVTAAAATDNTGTLGVSAVEVTAAAAGAYSPMTVRFTDDVGSYEVLDANATVLSSGTYHAGTPVAVDNLALTLSGQPKSGDRVLVTPTVHMASSNGNALTMQLMGDRALVGGTTATDAFASALSDVGVRTQSSRTAASQSATALQTANSQLTGETGVNLDEEAAKLIQYQQGYQAAAKVLQTAQTMLDTVIGIMH